jgi:hypothetical protein
MSQIAAQVRHRSAIASPDRLMKAEQIQHRSEQSRQARTQPAIADSPMQASPP